ncbi:N-acetyltransferase [uncultured Cedecea sp.]|uniref:N-acetyltransferase n=1 Tax=uncultured Cedecea sp. TaxID=988762 RepID=UPI00262BC0EC|nr:N-acetyltransferase [uncultured Cedecea sp.]
MILPFKPHQLDALMSLWLDSTISGHPFIDPGYWHDSCSVVRDVYIPHSETWVYMQEDKLIGFISIIEQQFIGALFVDSSYTGNGIGGQLLKHAQSRYSALSLEVYQKNQQAVHFYHHLGFRIEEAAWQSETQHPTWIMCWKKNEK